MKTSLGTKILSALILLAVLAYFGIQAYSALADPLITSVAYVYQAEETISANGYVVREERILPDSGGEFLRLSRSEGARVSAGGKIAEVFADQASLDRQTQIDALRGQLEQLEYAVQSAAANETALHLDSQIAEKLLALRRNVSAGRIDAAEDYMDDLKMLVLRRDYTYTDSADLTVRISEITGQINALKAQSTASVQTVTAPQSGLYSAVSDGYESVLTPDMLDTLTPSVLTGLRPGAETSRLGKLVLGDTWYYAASIAATDAQRLSEGTEVALRFAKGVDRDLKVKVKSVSAEENGRVAVVFQGDTFLSELTLLRAQSADIILFSVTGLRVPRQAVRVNEEGDAGVFCVVGGAAKFKPAEILWTADDGYVLIRGLGRLERALRDGDQVIITTAGLSDGAVLDQIES